jgi:hypothetical protein
MLSELKNYIENNLTPEVISIIAITFILGLTVGLFLKRKKIVSEGYIFPYDMEVTIDEIHKNKEDSLTKEIEKKLGPYIGELTMDSPRSFILHDVSVSFFKIDDLLSSINVQPLEKKQVSVAIDYISVQAAGSLSVNILINASPGSTVHLDDYNYSWEVGGAGFIEEAIKISKSDLLKGYIQGRVIKGGLKENIKIEL